MSEGAKQIGCSEVERSVYRESIVWFHECCCLSVNRRIGRRDQKRKEPMNPIVSIVSDDGKQEIKFKGVDDTCKKHPGLGAQPERNGIPIIGRMAECGSHGSEELTKLSKITTV